MKIIISIPGKAISTNSRLKPIRNKRTGQMRLVSNNSNNGRKKEISTFLLAWNKELVQLGKIFDRKRNYFKTSYKFFYKVEEFWTAKGEMNSKLLDADNGIKTVKDLVFEVIGVNDRLSRVESSEVTPAIATYFQIEIELMSWADLKPELRAPVKAKKRSSLSTVQKNLKA